MGNRTVFLKFKVIEKVKNSIGRKYLVMLSPSKKLSLRK
jgi:hypothetical protein